MTEFMRVVEDVKYSHSAGSPRRAFNSKKGGQNGEWQIIKHTDDQYNIIFTSNEGEVQTIPYFMLEDIMKLVDLQYIIDGRIDLLTFGLREMIEKIEGYVDKYSNDPYKILHDADSWSSDGVIVELACNFIEFFITLVRETKNTTDEPQQHE